MNRTLAAATLAFATLASTQCGPAEDLEEQQAARQAAAEQDPDTLRCQAEQGDVAAQIDLAHLYEEGDVVPLDTNEAAKWYRKAAEQYRKAAERGDASTQMALARMYRDGKGVPQNTGEAFKWYRRAAEQGDASAQEKLAWMYGSWAVSKDYKEAAKWRRKAAEQGYSAAQTNLALMYMNGEGVPQDYREAAKWYRKGAERGNFYDQNALAKMYERGQGVPQDYVTAHAWHNLAAMQRTHLGSAIIAWNIKDRDKLAAKMTPEQIDRAQTLAAEMFQRIEASREGTHAMTPTLGAAILTPALLIAAFLAGRWARPGFLARYRQKKSHRMRTVGLSQGSATRSTPGNRLG